MNRRENTSALETVEQQQFVAWANMQGAAWDELEMLFAIPNGGKRGKAEAARLVAEGVKAGVPDMMLAVPKTVTLNGEAYSSCGLWLEFKRAKGGRLSKEQKDWMARLWKRGYCAARVNGFDDALTVVCWYLNRPRPYTGGNCLYMTGEQIVLDSLDQVVL